MNIVMPPKAAGVILLSVPFSFSTLTHALQPRAQEPQFLIQEAAKLAGTIGASFITGGMQQ